MRIAERSISTLVVAVLATGGCARTRPAPSAALEGPWSPAPDIATRAELTCASDGTTTLSPSAVQPQLDGVHLRVTNQFNEPVSVEGFDANPGVTNWVLTQGPGTMELMCWPFSDHGSGDEPRRVPLEIVDPLGLYVDGTVPCEIDAITTVDWAKSPIDEGPPPLGIARDIIKGLRPDDVLRIAGYPEQEGGSVVVIREGEIIASYGIKRFEGEPWAVVAGRACEGTGLQFEGEAYG